ncbi:MAG: EAL domain-containing protein [Kofleriaceae bacterium]
MEQLDRQRSRVEQARVSSEDQPGLEAFWELYSRYGEDCLVDDPRRCADAIKFGAWQPFLDGLRVRGANFATMGVPFTTWFSSMTSTRALLREQIVRHGRGRSELCTRGMNCLMFVVLETIGEGYISCREQVATEAASAREELMQQSDKLDAIGRLANGVAHDFNNALSVITVYSTFLEEELPVSDVRHADATEIRRASERAKELTLKLAMLSCNSLARVTSLDLDTTIAELEPALRHLLADDIELVIKRSPVPRVLADPHHIEQVVTNLVVNAGEALSDGGNVTIALEVVHDTVVLAVSDNGGGMKKEVQRRLFEPYFTTKPRNRNSGLGLAIVQGIVAQAGGRVSVLSELGHGTTVRVHLPVISADTIVRPRLITTENLPLQPATVLVVDDQPELRNAVVRILKAAGCTTLEADSAEGARRICATDEQAIDVVLFEVSLGAQVIAQLQGLRPSIKIVLTSAFPAPPLDGTPVALLVKPFSSSALRSAVATAMLTPAASPDGVQRVTTNLGRHSRVLLVDEDAHIRAAIARNLHLAGLEVVAVAEGDAAFTALATSTFDVIIYDVTALTGLEFVRGVRRTDLDVPVILTTGAPSVEGSAAAIECGAFRYMAKPFDSGALVKAVHHAARAHALARLRREAFTVGGAPAVDRVGLEARFEKAMDGIFMVFQPIVDARTGVAFGFEALLRTTEPSLPAPQIMLEVAAALGHMPVLGRRVRTLSALALARRTGELSLFVNLHPEDLFDDALVDESLQFVQLAHRIVLEVTERTSLSISPALTERLIRLRSLGFRLAIDDIGSGYSGLTSFTELDPEIVKLDMAIVRDVHRSLLKQRTIRALCRLCHDGGCLVVGEGVETEDERSCLTELGCDLLQGFLIARPEPEVAIRP